jgi:hypothetical protein
MVRNDMPRRRKLSIPQYAAKIFLGEMDFDGVPPEKQRAVEWFISRRARDIERGLNGDRDMQKFRKKPVVIEAVQADGTPDINRKIIDWTRGSRTPASMDKHPDHGSRLSIATLEGAMWVSPGDWIIKGINGEFYPCKPDVFAATYDPA